MLKAYVARSRCLSLLCQLIDDRAAAAAADWRRRIDAHRAVNVQREKVTAKCRSAATDHS